MWHFRFFGTILAVLALLGFMESPTALAAQPDSSEFSMSQPRDTRGLVGTFQLAVMGNNAVPLDMPVENFSQKAQPEKPAVEKPKATPQKASKPKKKKVKTARVKKAPAKKPVAAVKEEEGFLARTLKTLLHDGDDKKKAASKSMLQKSAGEEPALEEKEGLLTKTFNMLVSDGDDKKKSPSSESPPQKTAENKKSKPEKKEDGLLTKTLKRLMGGDKKEEQTAKKTDLNPIGMVPGSATKKKTEEQPKTAKSETKATLKDSFEKLIGVGNVKDAGDSQPAKNKEFAGPLGGGDKKNSSKLVKAEETVEKTPAPAKPRKFTARKYVDNEEAQLEKNRGGVEKGKNVLKESFKHLVSDDKNKAIVEK
jgi:hypothetical protein